MKHVVFNSGGIGSYIAAKRVAARHGTEGLIHLFTDTRSEDEDLYRFLRESTAAIGGELVWLADGRDLWELFAEQGMIANTRADLCSRILKRDIARRWIQDRFPDQTGVTLHFGIDHSERHRFYGSNGKLGIRNRWMPYVAEAPLCDESLSKCDMLQECERDGIDPPRLYDVGAPHNNCGGFCVKAGHAHFLWLMNTLPEVFDTHASAEDAFRVRTGKDVSVMRDRRGGVSKPLPMLEFRRQVENGDLKVNPRDWGKGCQCFFNEEDTDAGA